MIKTRIFKFVGHIHNMQLCIEMISFINHENESILRWFSGLFSRILCPVAGCIQTGWGSDLCLPAVVLWNSAPHVSTMLRSNLDLSDSVLDMLHCLCYANIPRHNTFLPFGWSRQNFCFGSLGVYDVRSYISSVNLICVSLCVSVCVHLYVAGSTFLT